MRKDVKDLIKSFHVKTFGNMKNLEMLESEILSDEKLLYITPTNIKIIDRANHKTEALPGVLFISDLRVVFRYGVGRLKIKEFPLLDISAVASKGNSISGGHISFCTENERIDFLTSYKKVLFMKIEAVLLTAVNNALKDYNDNKLAYNPSRKYQVIDCLGCGALNIVKKDIIRSCEYCGRPQVMK